MNKRPVHPVVPPSCLGIVLAALCLVSLCRSAEAQDPADAALSVASAQMSDSASSLVQTPQQEDAAQAAAPKAEVLEQVRRSMRSLWLESVQSPSGASAASMPAALSTAIQELGVLQLAARKAVVAAAPALAEAATLASEPASAPSLAASAPAGLSERTLQTLSSLKVQDVRDPAGMGDTFFAAGELKAAGILYALALKKEGQADVSWAIFQKANCIVAQDPAGALALYQRVVDEHAASPWAAIAKAKAEVIQWKQQAKPDLVLQKTQSLIGE